MRSSSIINFVTFSFVAIFLVTNAKAQQPYSCQFLKLISDATNLQNQLYKEYVIQGKKSPKKVLYATSIDVDPEYAKKNATLQSKKGVFDDILFHMSDKILLVDTFNFFSETCVFNDKQKILIVSDLKDTTTYLKEYTDIVVLKSIRSYGRHFIIALQHINSTAEPRFYFNLKANYPPVLDYIKYELGIGVPIREEWTNRN